MMRQPSRTLDRHREKKTLHHFCEDEIRPGELMTGQRRAILIDIKRLLSKRKEFVFVNCPACGSRSSASKFSKYGLHYSRCSKCATLYINPRPSPEVLEWFYKGSVNYAYWNNFIFPASEKQRRVKIIVPRVDKVLELCDKYGIDKGSILEVGAAFGTFCVEMKSRNKFMEIIAVEPTPDLARTCRQKGIKTIEDTIENVHLHHASKFDVIVNFEVIEHLFSPRSFITQCHRLQKRNGLLVLSCPNVKGFDFVVLGHLCNSIDHEHLNYFNPDSISHLLNKCGYDVLECPTPGRLDAELVRNKILAKELDVSRQPFLHQILVERWESVGEQFQNFLSDNGLSSSMWVIAKKR